MSQEPKTPKVFVLLAWLGVIIVIPPVLLYLFFFFASLEKVNFEEPNPAGLGEARFTLADNGIDGPSRLIISARTKGDWLWTEVVRFDTPYRCPKGFHEVRWTKDGKALLVWTSIYGGKPILTHAFDFTHSRPIAPNDTSAENIESALSQIKSLIGTSELSAPIHILDNGCVKAHWQADVTGG